MSSEARLNFFQEISAKLAEFEVISPTLYPKI